nr:uroporphyrinogen-III synthase [uncultured Holophaga sp.]
MRSGPRLALARSEGHPLWKQVVQAGWTPVTYLCATLTPSAEPPLEGPWDAALVLSPAGARALRPHLPPGLPCLVTGPGTARALDGVPGQIILPGEARAEGLWAALQARFPSGGRFLLVRGERSRGFLDAQARDTPWKLSPWTSHREVPLRPQPPLPKVEAVLALSPLQAELLAPLSGDLLRFAWGERSAAAFARAGCPATAHCLPEPGALERLLRAYLTID